MKSWLNIHPTWQHWFWSEGQARRLIGRKYPQYLDLYDQYPYKINRADVRRYFIMYEYGGVYADLDVESLRPLDELLELYPCVIAQEPLVHQVLLYANNASNFAMPALIACRPQHPFLKLLIDELSHYISLAWTLAWNDNILQSTGPHYVAHVLRLYQSKHNNSGDNYIHVAPSHWFMPEYDRTNLSAFLAMCSQHNDTVSRRKFVEACQQLNRTSVSDTVYSNHHWLHTWSNHFRTNTSKSVEESVPGIHMAAVT